ncbi:hypothetical protein [Shewanella waksmanii]|uniref:hypothetical protein n=1 Tax=Shewanella waksmanii TaxID=213783 RepID=UPI003734E1E2
MLNVVRRQTLVIFTLLAMLGQVLLSNGFAMVPMAQAEESHSMMQMTNGASCHTVTSMETASHCCDAELSATPLPEDNQHCCNGNGTCQADCNHCLVISVTGTLFDVKTWSGFNGSQHAMATQMPHFHSISLARDLRPPIA